jgi:cation diffusion facilitator CzcD-associated flavoprotein CzcO
MLTRKPSQDEFQGQILHSTQHKDALDHAGKKVAVIGACTSAHDLAADYADHGVGVYFPSSAKLNGPF